MVILKGVRMNPVDKWRKFSAMVEKRIEAGRTEYGDLSFRLPPAILAGEIKEELFDVAAWAFILAERIEAIEAKMKG